MSVLRFTDGLN